jgi:hypothetical protein
LKSGWAIAEKTGERKWKSAKDFAASANSTRRGGDSPATGPLTFRGVYEMVFSL